MTLQLVFGQRVYSNHINYYFYIAVNFFSVINFHLFIVDSGRKTSEYLFWCVKSCQFSVKVMNSELDNNSERTNKTS